MPSPAFPLYAADFLTDENVELMDNQQLGCYVRLLCYSWREGSIPADIGKVARLCREDGSAMAQLWTAISLCFVEPLDNPGRLINPRQEKERKKQRDYQIERANSGSKGAKSRWDKHSADISKTNRVNGLAIGSAIREPIANDGFSTSTSISTSNTNTEDNVGSCAPTSKRPNAPKPDEYTTDFLAFWDEYPRKVDKKGAFGTWKAQKRKGVSVDDLMTATRHYAASCEGKEQSFILHPSTFLGSRDRWQDYMSEPEPEEKGGPKRGQPIPIVEQNFPRSKWED